MTLRLAGSTSGYTEIDAPAVAGSNTLVLPSGAGSAHQFMKNGATPGSLGWSTLTEDGSGNMTQNGYPAAVCRAWVNFNGTGTVAIRASYNVSSITDNGVGDYTVNFTTAMVDVNFTLVAIANGFSSFEDNNAVRTSTRTTSSIAVRSINGAATANVDSAAFQVAIFR